MKSFVAVFVCCFSFFPLLSFAAMQSESYVIYENVHHVFDGPVISGVSVSVSENRATVTWTTNVPSDGFVVYNTDSALPHSSNLEQGLSSKIYTSHSVVLTNLDYSTTYYFRVKSTRLNGGTSQSQATLSFATGADPADSVEPTPPPSTGGGGVLIIDKTDKEEPLITNVTATAVDSRTAVISWETNEESTSFVEYGLSTNYGSVYGEWGTKTEHSVRLENLEPNTTYNYRALSSDSWGNLGKSDNFVIAIVAGEDEEPEIVEGIDEVEEPIIPEEPDVPEEPSVPEDPVLDRVREAALDLLRRLFPSVSLNELTDEQLNSIGSIEEMSDFSDVPLISGQPRIDVGSNQATIYWSTDIEADSQVAIAPADRYRPGTNEPYNQIIGNTQNHSTEHEVTIYNLVPDTTYHFQLRSKPRFGPMAVSRDFTFTTNLETLSIESYFTQVISNEVAVVKWITNKEADSSVRYSPYQGNEVALDLQKVVRSNNQTVIHEVTLSDLQGGVYYQLEIQSEDEFGNVATRFIERFSTSETDEPPIISHVKSESTVFLDKSNRTQTIISWLTNEPATSRVYYQEGVHGSQVELLESTDLKSSYAREHLIVITKFKPGVVYSFRVESIDSGGNASLSKVHTFMTAKQSESIIQIIIRIFEDSFGWVKKLM